MRSAATIAIGLAVAGLLVAAPASANGRFPATVNTRFQPGDTELILVPSTFGLLLSSDGGESFRWVCENTIGYGGTYDPDYAVTTDGNIYSTTFEGLRLSTDGSCSYETTEFLDSEGTALEGIWVGEVEIASDGKIWAATSTGGQPNDVFVSEDGTTFNVAGLHDDIAWWKSLKIAASDPDRIYVSGFRVAQSDDEGNVIEPARALLYRTANGGESWDELAVDDFEFGPQPSLVIEAVSPTNPDVVFARAVGAIEPVGDALYRSTDGGDSWEKVLEFAEPISAFLIRSDGTTVFAASVNPCADDPPESTKGCVRVSTDTGASGSWSAPTEEPKMACLGERSDGTLFACGANWEPDMFAFGRSEDGQTWEKVMRFVEIAGPLECPMDTAPEQHSCAALMWPSLCQQLGICEGPADAGPGMPDGGPGADCPDGEDCEGTCGCEAGGGAAGALLVLLFFGPLWALRRRSMVRE